MPSQTPQASGTSTIARSRVSLSGFAVLCRGSRRLEALLKSKCDQNVNRALSHMASQWPPGDSSGSMVLNVYAQSSIACRNLRKEDGAW